MHLSGRQRHWWAGGTRTAAADPKITLQEQCQITPQNTADPANLGAEQQLGDRSLGKEMPQPLLEPVLQLVPGETELWWARQAFTSQGAHRNSHSVSGMQGAHVYSLYRVFLGLGKRAGKDDLHTFPL